MGRKHQPPGVGLILQKFKPGGAGLDRIGLDRTVNQNYFTYGAGFDWRTPDNVWTLTGEVFGQVGAAEVSSVVDPRFQLGLRYRPVDRFNVDLIYGRNLTGENANWITLATIVRFPPPEK